MVFAATLVFTEHLTYLEFLQRIPETTHLASCLPDPMGVNAALQLDLKVVFPIALAEGLAARESFRHCGDDY